MTNSYNGDHIVLLGLYVFVDHLGNWKFKYYDYWVQGKRWKQSNFIGAQPKSPIYEPFYL